jgi:hypothetical protein
VYSALFFAVMLVERLWKSQSLKKEKLWNDLPSLSKKRKNEEKNEKVRILWKTQAQKSLPFCGKAPE